MSLLGDSNILKIIPPRVGSAIIEKKQKKQATPSGNVSHPVEEILAPPLIQMYHTHQSSQKWHTSNKIHAHNQSQLYLLYSTQVYATTHPFTWALVPAQLTIPDLWTNPGTMQY